MMMMSAFAPLAALMPESTFVPNISTSLPDAAALPPVSQTTSFASVSRMLAAIWSAAALVSPLSISRPITTISLFGKSVRSRASSLAGIA